jgi:hypothetical protein
VSLFNEEDLKQLIASTVRAILREELATGLEVSRDEYLSIGAAARIAAVAPSTVRTWMDQGMLHRYQAGRVLRVRRGELIEFLRAGPAKAARTTRTPEEAALLMFERRRKAG